MCPARCCSSVCVREELVPDGVRAGVPGVRAQEAAAAGVHRRTDRQISAAGHVPAQHHRRHRQADGQGAHVRGTGLQQLRPRRWPGHHLRFWFQGIIFISSNLILNHTALLVYVFPLLGLYPSGAKNVIFLLRWNIVLRAIKGITY